MWLHNSAWDEQKTRTYHPAFIEANGSEVNSLLCWLQAGAQDFLQLFIHEVLRLRGENIWSVSHNRSIIGWMLCKISSINILNFQYTLTAKPKDTSAHTSMTLNLTLMELTLEKTYILYLHSFGILRSVFDVLAVSYSPKHGFTNILYNSILIIHDSLKRIEK